MKYFAFLTFLIFAGYLLGFIKKPEKTSGWTEIIQQQLKVFPS